MTELQRRIAFTLGALAVYRLGVHIPMPGIDFDFLWSRAPGGSSAGSGDTSRIAIGWFSGFSIFALGVIPYLTAAVLMRLASAISPRLRAAENRSPAGRRKIVRITRLLAVLIAGLEALGWAKGFNATQGIATEPGLVFRFGIAATMTTGFVAIMWLSDQITQRGIGNGVALILFSDIVVELPGTLAALMDLVGTRQLNLGLAISLLLSSVAVVAGIVFIERAVRHVWVRYPKNDFADHSFGGQYASIPLKLNNGGFIPAWIAGWLLTHAFGLVMYIMLDGRENAIEGWLRWGWPGHPVHLAVSAILIFAMAYIYTAALLDPGDLARHLREKGATALNAEPGAETERAFRRLLRGLSLFGGVYLAFIYLLPEIHYIFMPVLPGWIGGIGFLIATAVAMDTLAHLAHRWNRDHESEPVGGELGDAIAIAMEIPDQPKVRETRRQ